MALKVEVLSAWVFLLALVHCGAGGGSGGGGGGACSSDSRFVENIALGVDEDTLSVFCGDIDGDGSLDIASGSEAISAGAPT